MYSIRVINSDSYQAEPIPNIDPIFSQFRGSEIKQVPVIRIFGITLTGEKVCLHMHGVFPYLYVPYSGQINTDILLYHLATALDAAINVSFGCARSNTQHIYKIQEVSGIPYYGYHRKKHHFLKIYFYNPAIIKRATGLLQGGTILDQHFQPYEAHIPFVLQFMIDFNIYGMSTIDLRNFKYRHGSMTLQTERGLSMTFNDILDSSSGQKEYMPFSVTRQSVCQIEIDAMASDIINREVIDKGIDLNPGIAAIWQEEKSRRAQANLGGDSQLIYPKSPERTKAAEMLTNNDVYQQTRLAQRLCVIDSQNDESSLSSGLQNLSYPVPVPDNSNLINASHLEVHTGLSNLNTTQKFLNESHKNVNNDSMISSLQSQSSVSNISLNSSELNIVEILVNLANDQEDIPSSVDSNSILGSQKLEPSYENFFVEEGKDVDSEEGEEEVLDLNLTNLQLSNLNFSSWEVNEEKLQVTPCISNESQIVEPKLESLNQPVESNLSDDIPQLDGPIDNENANTSNINKDTDLTIESQEFVICEYKSGRGQKRSRSVTPVTPRKRNRTPDIDDDNLCDGAKKKKRKDFLPKTPRRSPSNRKNKLTSPSCPNRNYSPLNLEITNGQKTPKTSPCTSPSAKSIEREKILEKFHRKRIFSPVKESVYEEGYILPTKLNTSKTSSTSAELFESCENTSDSDRTLVEDSDDSLNIVIPSSSQNPTIINDSDSNSTTASTEKQSNILNFHSKTLQTLLEEEPVEENELSFTQLLEAKQKTVRNRSSLLSFKESSNKAVTLVPKFNPPSREYIVNSLEKYGIPKCNNVEPFFSKQEDADASSRNQITDSLYRVRGTGLASLAPFRSSLEGVIGLESWRKKKAKEFLFPGETLNSLDLKLKLAGQELVTIRPLKLPPDRKSVVAWVKARKQLQNRNEVDTKKKSEISHGRSCNTTVDTSCQLSNIFRDFDNGSDGSKHLGISCGQIEFNSRSSVGDVAKQNLANVKALTTYQYLTVLCLEVHVITRPNLLPDPRYDAIGAIFYAIYNDVPPNWSKAKPLDCGAVIVNSDKANLPCTNSNDIITELQLVYVENEEALLEKIASVTESCDPEILIGWDIEFLSWGYMFNRASVLGTNLSGKFSRIPNVKSKWETPRDQSTPDVHLETLTEVKLPGRIILDIWRLMRYEIALTSYTYENVMFHVMNERIPQYSFQTLTKWWQSLNTQWRVIDLYSNKVIGIHRLLHHLDIINRTSEHARLYGIQFYEVFSRGSQFRVESMMLRLAKPLNYIPVSPSAQQRGCMRAPESLPLILEPESTMYCDPVIVLDFQSLYPSIIIAYNYCFSTCLGRIEHIGSNQPFEFGAATLKVPKKLAIKLQNKFNFAPCGVAFVKKEVREGILPRMLTEILDTRLMVKKAIKDHPKEDKALQRALHSRQLGLKLIANVTYGYTAANFSGRMPCIEVGDSIVSKGKETLERAIKIVESTLSWRARVIYGDTDSLFVLLKGRSREEAFKIGAEIADTVTAANPKPVKLKFEKVLQPCILQTKKRYCGYMYENINDKPVYLAKGIETVRRDGCPAVAKILEKALKILFDTKDLSQVKQYVIRQLDKILSGRVSIQDLTFAKEFRGMRGYKAAACVPALELTRRLIQKDPRAIPRTGARVPYIIIAGGPNETLIRCVRAPMELVLDPCLRPNAIYYITKVIIPPLNRCMNLIGIDCYAWYMEMPHRQATSRKTGMLFNVKRKQKTTISQYLCNTTCPSCGRSCDKGICTDCIKNLSQTLVILHEQCRQYGRIYSNTKLICESCIGVMDADNCISLDCPIFYRRSQAQRDNAQISYLYDLIQSV